MQLAPNAELPRAGVLERRVALWREENPEKKAIRLDRDVSSQPMRGAPLAAMQAAVAQLGCKGTFPGRSPACGHHFLREAFALSRTGLAADEVFVAPGRYEAYARLFSVLTPGARVVTVEPCDGLAAAVAASCGHTVLVLSGTAENGFLPLPEHVPQADILCLGGECGATGEAYGAHGAALWAEYAAAHGVVLLADTTYAPFCGPQHTRPEWRGAVEIRGLEAVEGFCGADCALLGVPRCLGAFYDVFRAHMEARENGVAFPVQRAAAALLETESGREPVTAWRENAAVIRNALEASGLRFWGGQNAPFFWLRCPEKYAGDSAAFCTELLTQTGVVCAEGPLFGAGGQGWLRISALGDKAATEIGMKRLLPFFMG